jgi:hypothetical protein
MEQIECSETSAYKIQTPVNYPEENIQHDKTIWTQAMAKLFYLEVYHNFQFQISECTPYTSVSGFNVKISVINPYPANAENMVSS